VAEVKRGEGHGSIQGRQKQRLSGERDRGVVREDRSRGHPGARGVVRKNSGRGQKGRGTW
jgi:hypothetical protein